jgi:hypothetical protein
MQGELTSPPAKKFKVEKSTFVPHNALSVDLGTIAT